MYEDFFGFDQPPFNVTPDSEFFYPGELHFEALSEILYGVEERKGFVTLTGPIGSGKTTLCRALLQELGDDTSTALVLNSRMKSRELLQAILSDFGLETPTDPSVKQLVDRLNDFLLTEFNRGRNVCVIIDEAQNLSADALENLRLLSNLETEKAKLLQIVLVGQPELRNLLESPELRQLHQRIHVWIDLEHLTSNQTEQYINHRLRTAGNPALTVDPEVYEQVYEITDGNPREINLLFDRVLMAAFVNDAPHIKVDHVNQALEDSTFPNQATLEESTSTSPPTSSQNQQQSNSLPRGLWMIFGSTKRFLGVLALAVVLAGLAYGIARSYNLDPLVSLNAFATEKSPHLFWQSSSREFQETPVRSSEPTKPAPASIKTDLDLPAPAQSPGSGRDRHETTAQTIPNPLNIKPQPQKEEKTGGLVLARWLSYHLDLTSKKSTLKNRFDVPGRYGDWKLKETVPEVLPGRWVIFHQNQNWPESYGHPAFLSWETDGRSYYRIWFPDHSVLWDPAKGSLPVDSEQAFAGWQGEVVVLIRTTFNPKNVYQRGEVGRDIADLQQMLNRSGSYQLPTTGRYGPLTESALRDFQDKHDLRVDALAGPRTNMTLLQTAGVTFHWSRSEIQSFLMEVGR